MLFISLAALAIQAAQPATNPSNDDAIIVQGQRLTDPKKALKVVKAITISGQSQLARFHQPVCPFVTGLTPETETIVRNRIRTVAKEVGAPVAPENCQWNLVVAITEDAAALINTLRAKNPEWFMSMSQSDMDRLVSQGPIRNWSIVNVRDDTGFTANPDRSIRGTASRGGTASDPTVNLSTAVGSGSPHTRVREASLFRNVSKYYLDGSFIIIDSKAAEGLTLRQIGDYAAMRGLARVNPPADPGSSYTIMNLFSSNREAAPKRLTRFDERYLTALYKGKGTEKAIQEQNRIARLMVDDK